MMQRISKEELAQNLVRQVEIADDLTPEEALGIMLYGWRKWRKYGKKYWHAVESRDWLYVVEVMDLSTYAQVDLCISHSDEFCEGE